MGTMMFDSYAEYYFYMLGKIFLFVYILITKVFKNTIITGSDDGDNNNICHIILYDIVW